MLAQHLALLNHLLYKIQDTEERKSEKLMVPNAKFGKFRVLFLEAAKSTESQNGCISKSVAACQEPFFTGQKKITDDPLRSYWTDDSNWGENLKNQDRSKWKQSRADSNSFSLSSLLLILVSDGATINHTHNQFRRTNSCASLDVCPYNIRNYHQYAYHQHTMNFRPNAQATQSVLYENPFFGRRNSCTATTF